MSLQTYAGNFQSRRLGFIANDRSGENADGAISGFGNNCRGTRVIQTHSLRCSPPVSPPRPPLMVTEEPLIVAMDRTDTRSVGQSLEELFEIKLEANYADNNVVGFDVGVGGSFGRCGVCDDSVNRIDAPRHGYPSSRQPLKPTPVSTPAPLWTHGGISKYIENIAGPSMKQLEGTVCRSTGARGNGKRLQRSTNHRLHNNARSDSQQLPLPRAVRVSRLAAGVEGGRPRSKRRRRRFTLGQAMRAAGPKGMPMSATGHATMSAVVVHKSSRRQSYDSREDQGIGTGRGVKLTVVSKYITHISGVPASVAAPVTQLLLSNNSLHNLGRLSGALFPNLECVSLCNNQLRYLEVLVPLKTLPHLNNLILEGNPVTHMPNYRAQLVTHLGALTTLDKRPVGSDPDFHLCGDNYLSDNHGVEITRRGFESDHHAYGSSRFDKKVATRAAAQRERVAAAAALRREASLQEALFDNACAAQALQFLRPLLAVHNELRQRLLGPRFGRAVHLSDGRFGDLRSGGFDSTMQTLVPSPTLSDVLRVWRPSQWVRRFRAEARRVHRGVQDELALRFYRMLESRALKGAAAAAGSTAEIAVDARSNATSERGFGNYVTATASRVIARSLSAAETHQLWDVLMTQQLQAQQEILVILVRSCELNRENGDFYCSARARRQQQQPRRNAMSGGEGLQQFLQAESAAVAAQLIQAKAAVTHRRAASSSSQVLSFAEARGFAPLECREGVGHPLCRPLWGPPSLPAQPGCDEHDDYGYQLDHYNEQNAQSMDTFSAYDETTNVEAAAGGIELNLSASAPISPPRSGGHGSLNTMVAAASSDSARMLHSSSSNSNKNSLRHDNTRMMAITSTGAPGAHVVLNDKDAYGRNEVGDRWDATLADISEPNGTSWGRVNTTATSRSGGGSGDRDFHARTAAAAAEAAFGADQYLRRMQQHNKNATSSSSSLVLSSARHQRERYDEQPDTDHCSCEFGSQGGEFGGSKGAQGLRTPLSVQPVPSASQVQMASSTEKSGGGSRVKDIPRSELVGHRHKEYQSTHQSNNADGMHVVHADAEVAEALANSWHRSYAQQRQQRQQPTLEGLGSSRASSATTAIFGPSSGQSRSNVVQAGGDRVVKNGSIGMDACDESNVSVPGYRYDEGIDIASVGGSGVNCNYQYQHQSFHPEDVANAERVLRQSLTDIDSIHDGGGGGVLTLDPLPASPTSLDALIRNGNHESGGVGKHREGGGGTFSRPVVPEPVEAGHSMRELEAQVSGALDDLKAADAGFAEVVALNAALRSHADEVIRLRDRRVETLVVTEKRLVQRHNDLVHAVAEMMQAICGGQVAVPGTRDHGNSSNDSEWDAVVLRLDEEVPEDAEEKRARGEDLKQAQVELQERQAIHDAVMTRVDEAQASIDEEERRRDELMVAKQRIAADTTRMAAKLADIRTAFMLSASGRTVGGVRLCTLEESGLASKLFCGGASFASWAFTRLRRACDIRRRFRNSPILGVGASAGGCGGGQPLRRQRTYFRRLRLSTRLKRLRKRLRMVRALRSWRIYLAVVAWKQGVQGPQQCRAAVKRWWVRVADRKERHRVLETHLMEGGRAAHKNSTLLFMLRDLLSGSNGRAERTNGKDGCGGNLQLRRFFGAWHAHAHAIAKQSTTIALAFWCVRFLRRWLRLASFTRLRLTARSEVCGAKRLLVRWRRRWQVERLSRRAFKRRALLQVADAVAAVKRRREHRATAGYLGERALLQRTFWIFRQEARNVGRVRLVMHRLQASNKTGGLVRGFTCWKAIVHTARVQQTASFLSASHFLQQLRQRLWLRWRRLAYHQRELRCLLHGFVETCALLRQQGAFRSWLWKLVGPTLLSRFVESVAARHVQRLLLAWAAVGATRHRFSTLSAVVEQRQAKRLRRICFSGWVAGALRFSLRRLYEAEQRRGDAIERELDEQFANVLPCGRDLPFLLNTMDTMKEDKKALAIESEQQQDQRKYEIQLTRGRRHGGNDKTATAGIMVAASDGGEAVLWGMTHLHHLAPPLPPRPAITTVSSVSIDDLVVEEDRRDGALFGTSQRRSQTGTNTRSDKTTMRMSIAKHEVALLRDDPLARLRRRLGFAEYALAAAVAGSTAEAEAVAAARATLSALQRQAVAGHVDSEKLQTAAEAKTARTAQLAAELAAKTHTLDDCVMAVELLKAELRSIGGEITSERCRSSDDNDDISGDHDGDRGLERVPQKKAAEAGLREAAAGVGGEKALQFSVPTLNPSFRQRLSELSCEVREWQRKEAAARSELASREAGLHAAVGLEGTTGIRGATTASTQATSGDQTLNRNDQRASSKKTVRNPHDINGKKREHRSGASSVSASASAMHRNLPLSGWRAAGRMSLVVHVAGGRGLSALEVAVNKTRALAIELDERDTALAALVEERDALLEGLADANEGRSSLFGAITVAVAEAEAEAEALEATNCRLRERLEVQWSTAVEYEERLEAALEAMKRAETARRTKLGELASTSNRTKADPHIVLNLGHDDASAGGGTVVLDDPQLHGELAEQRAWRERWEARDGHIQQKEQRQMGMGIVEEDIEVLSAAEGGGRGGAQPYSAFADFTDLGGTVRGDSDVGGSVLADAAAVVEAEIAQERAATVVAAAHDAAVIEGAATRVRILRAEQTAADAAFRAQASSIQSMERAVAAADDAAAAKQRVDEAIQTEVARSDGSGKMEDLSGCGVHIGRLSGIEVGPSHIASASLDRCHLPCQLRNQNQDQDQGHNQGYLFDVQDGSVGLRPLFLRPSALTQVNEMPADAEPPLKMASQAVHELLGRARRGVVEGRLRSSRCALRESLGVGVNHDLKTAGHISNIYSAPVPDPGPVPYAGADLGPGAGRSVPLGPPCFLTGKPTSSISMFDDGTAADSAIWVGQSTSGKGASLGQLEVQQQQQQQQQQGGGVEVAEVKLGEAKSRMVALKTNIIQLSNRITARMNARAIAADSTTSTINSPFGGT